MPSTASTDPHPDTAPVGTFSLDIYPSREDWSVVEDWMIAEGWDPGYGDAQAITTLDKRALVIGMLDDEPISGISLLRVSEQYAFLGNYIVRPDHRGQGFGLATWRAVLPHAGGRVIGLDAVPQELETYRRAGFTVSHATISYQGIIPHGLKPRNVHVRPLEPDDRSTVIALDALCSPSERSGFLAAWFAASGTRTLVYRDRHEIIGFGSIRPSRTGFRIGPLIANTPAVALALYDALTAEHPGELVWINCPEPNTVGCDLTRERGLIRDSHTTRMYSSPPRPTALARCYSIASLAWG